MDELCTIPRCHNCGGTLCWPYDGRRRFCGRSCARAKRPCGIAGCASLAFAGGLCQGHYRENRKRNRGVNPLLVWFKGRCELCDRPWRSLVAQQFCSSRCDRIAAQRAEDTDRGNLAGCACKYCTAVSMPSKGVQMPGAEIGALRLDVDTR